MRRTGSADQEAATSVPAISVLHSFAGGGFWATQVFRGLDGNFYGLASPGVVFKRTSAGKLTTLHGFNNGSDGLPTALVQGLDGNLYGTTSNQNYVGGSVFKLTPGGELTTIYQFTGGADGRQPSALIASKDGNLYGLSDGGANGGGTVFKVTTSGALTTLCALTTSQGGYVFNSDDLIEGDDGSLYFLSELGGTTSAARGALFKVTKAGQLTSVYEFTGAADGGGPRVLAQGTDGNFYVASDSTASPGDPSGILSKITPSGALTLVHTFPPYSAGGLDPTCLVRAPDGNVYGATGYGNARTDGVLFAIKPSGFVTIHTFNGTDGSRAGSSLRIPTERYTARCRATHPAGATTSDASSSLFRQPLSSLQLEISG